jgi:hypothetical protein
MSPQTAPAPAPARLCVIGSSHVACLKVAADQDAAGLPPTDYFASSANTASDLRLSGGRWLDPGSGEARRQIAAVSGGDGRIDLAAYDAFALVGVCFQLRDYLRVFRRHCLWRHREWRAERGLLSDGAFRAFQASLYHFRPAYRLAAEIAAVRPGAPILFLTAPSPTTGLFDEKADAAFAPLRKTGYFAEIDRLHRAGAAAAARSVGARVIFQQDATLAAPGFTDARFNREAVGLQRPERIREDAWHGVKAGADPWHMNPAFGRTRLEDIRAALAA